MCCDTYCSCKFWYEQLFLSPYPFKLNTYFQHFPLKWMFYVLTQAHISYFSFYQCSTLFRKLFFLQSFNTSIYVLLTPRSVLSWVVILNVRQDKHRLFIFLKLFLCFLIPYFHHLCN